jgi:glyoxylase-like metal-dependent hydrolase (beta-lactamase superfamily II)
MTQTHITPQPAGDMKGTVVVSAYPNVRIHTYVSPPDGFLVNTHIVEGEASLVIFDGQLLNAYAAEVAAYASRLGKPVEQIIVSHGHPDHWAGLEVLAHSGRQRVHSSRRKERLHEGCLKTQGSGYNGDIRANDIAHSKGWSAARRSNRCGEHFFRFQSRQ